MTFTESMEHAAQAFEVIAVMVLIIGEQCLKHVDDVGGVVPSV